MISATDFLNLSEAILGVDEASSGTSSILGSPQLDEVFRIWCGRSPDRLRFGRSFRRKMLAGDTSRALELFTTPSDPLTSVWPVEFIDARRLPWPRRFHFSFGDSPFGTLLLISDEHGLCSMRFTSDAPTDLAREAELAPESEFVEKEMPWHASAVRAVGQQWTGEPPVPLMCRGTEFQLSIWRYLTTIPYGGLTTYGVIVEKLGFVNASRAVGAAVGANPWAGIVPCHRVVQGNGSLGGFAWGLSRKAALLAWEAQTT